MFSLKLRFIKKMVTFLYRQGGFLCKVCLAADVSFRQKYLEKIGKNGSVNNFLGQTIDKVSWIFRSVDWNGDNRPDNVGLDYDSQVNI